MIAFHKRNKIAQLLAERKMSIYRLAKDSKITYPTLHRLVRSDHIPPGTEYLTLEAVANVLNVKIEDLSE